MALVDFRSEALAEAARMRNKKYRLNVGAEDFSDLTMKGQNYLNRIKLFEGIGGYDSKVANLKAKAAKAGVDITKFEGQGDAQAWIDRLARSGDPVLARMAARYSTRLETGLARDAAKTMAQSEIAGGYTDLADQFRSFLSGPIDPNSGAFQAAGAQYVAGRKQALFDAMTEIDYDTAMARANFDANTLASIGDTLSTLRALEEQKKLARIQMLFGGVQAAGALIGGIGSLSGGGAAAA